MRPEVQRHLQPAAHEDQVRQRQFMRGSGEQICARAMAGIPAEDVGSEPESLPSATMRVCAGRAVARVAPPLGPLGRLDRPSPQRQRTPKENRMSPPSNPSCTKAARSRRRRTSSARRTSPGRRPTDALSAEAERDFEGFWARPRAREAALAQAVHARPRRVEGAVLSLVLRRRAQRVVQLPRPQP